MTSENRINDLLRALAVMPRAALAQLPTPIHQLENFGEQLGDVELWIKRDDLTGLEGGGNKTRKLEFLVGDAVAVGADMLVTAGAIQSNHTRQTAAAAAKNNLQCALLHFGWTKDAGPVYREVGNILLSSLMGAKLYLDETERPIEDQGPLVEFCEYLRSCGHLPYLIPAGASEHRLGSFGYMNCAAEINKQSMPLEVQFDYIVHCTGSSSTQAGLLAGFAAMGETIRVIGVADDEETDIKSERVLLLANDALAEIGASERLSPADVEIISADASPYGEAETETFDAISLLAQTEGLVADPVYEGKALRGLLKLAGEGRFEAGSRVLLMHLGGTPAVHAYSSQFDTPVFSPFPPDPGSS
jgi:1-aminocyclopropane-1-carboxylate deaminase